MSYSSVPLRQHPMNKIEEIFLKHAIKLCRVGYYFTVKQTNNCHDALIMKQDNDFVVALDNNEADDDHDVTAL